MALVKFFAPLMITSSGTRKESTFTVDNGVITDISHGRAPDAIELSGTVIPGFVDIHCHGGGGYDNSVDTRGAEFHLKHGTTTMLASFVSEPIDSILSKISKLEFARNVVGIHLEGPYLSHAHCGAHKPEYLSVPKSSDLAKIVETGKVRHITIAPEIEGALEAIAYLSSHGIVAAIGHSAAHSDIVKQAVDNGATVVTHLYNGMKKDYSDTHTLAGHALRDTRLGLEVILDGVHVPFNIVHDFIAEASSRLIGITDAAPFAGKPDGEYALGELPVLVVDGVARLKGGTSLAGSTLTMDRAFATAIHDLGMNPIDAVAMYCTRPAAFLGETSVGDIALSKKANFVVMSQDWNLQQVYFEGELVS